MSEASQRTVDPAICAECLKALIHSWGHRAGTKYSTIEGCVELIEQDLGNLNDLDPICSRLNTIKKEIKELQGYDSPFDSQYFPLNDLVSDRVAFLKTLPKFKGIKFTLDLAHQNPRIVANQIWTRDVLDVLFDNAEEAMDGSQDRTINISTSMQESSVAILVKDNGTGIDSDIYAVLFNRPVSGRDPSRGRGLYIARIVLALYGGEITVQETDPTGTAMLVLLPIASEPPNANEDQSAL